MATASEYEDFIYRVCEALGEPDGMVVYRNKTYTGRVSRRQITMEVSFEGQLLGARILGLVECKCYKSRVEVSDVEEFHSKLDDIGAHKGIMFTTVGYEAGAKKVAKGRGIALFILREGQQPGERRVETKAEKWPTTPNFLRRSFLPWGHFSASHDEVGYRVESADELFYLLAFSREARRDRIDPHQAHTGGRASALPARLTAAAYAIAGHPCDHRPPTGQRAGTAQAMTALGSTGAVHHF